jgi:iron(III) transport system substrate-binding protein
MPILITRRALVAGAATLPLISAARADTPKTKAEVYEAAKKEGKVVYWSALDQPAIKEMAKVFNKTYPGIQVEHFDILPGPALERMVNESRAGRLSVDAFDTPVSYSPIVLDRDLCDPFTWQETFGLQKTETFYDNKLIFSFTLDLPVAYNTKLVKPADVPKSWDDLLDPKWKGKILVEARGITFTILMTKWGEEKTIAYLRKLLANKPVIIRGGTPTMEAVAGGQVAIAIGTYGGKVESAQLKGAPIEWARVSPIPTQIYLNGTVKGAKHPNAARLWITWMRTPEAQAALYQNMHFGMVVGPTLSPLGQKMKDAHMEIVLESTDAKWANAMLKKVGDIIAGKA